MHTHDVPVTEEFLDRSDVVTILEQMRGKAARQVPHKLIAQIAVE